MKLLPFKTALPISPLSRRHTPAEQRWNHYTDCLRWDFGFTCPFCLLHEADLAEHGTNRHGLVWVEHHDLKSDVEEKADLYENCFYSCRFCNNSRSTRKRTDESGRTLLDPTSVAWADYFEWDGNALKPKAGDADAEYTHNAYRLDDPQKTNRRYWREKLLKSSQFLLKQASRRIGRLQQAAEMAIQEGDVRSARGKLEEIKQWQGVLETAVRQLQRFSPVPHDAPDQCRCEAEDNRTLPGWLARQTVEITV